MRSGLDLLVMSISGHDPKATFTGSLLRSRSLTGFDTAYSVDENWYSFILEYGINLKSAEALGS